MIHHEKDRSSKHSKMFRMMKTFKSYFVRSKKKDALPHDYEIVFCDSRPQEHQFKLVDNIMEFERVSIEYERVASEHERVTVIDEIGTMEDELSAIEKQDKVGHSKQIEDLVSHVSENAFEPIATYDAVVDVVGEFVRKWIVWASTNPDVKNNQREISRQIQMSTNMCMEWVNFEEEQCDGKLIAEVVGDHFERMNQTKLEIENMSEISKHITSVFQTISRHYNSEDVHVAQLWRIVKLLAGMRIVCIYCSEENLFPHQDTRVCSDTSCIPVVQFANKWIQLCRKTNLSYFVKDQHSFAMDCFVYQVSELALDLTKFYFNWKIYNDVLGCFPLQTNITLQKFPTIIRQLDVIIGKLLMDSRNLHVVELNPILIFLNMTRFVCVRYVRYRIDEHWAE
ncbi:MAG: hypothetical protein K0U78_02730 [Actinomycetia bacterium]|nr:hypothetical protein [Actinomycetes bacterium]